MAASLLGVGQASMMGLMSTSINPPPVAYRHTAASSPQNGSGRASGSTVSATSPAAAQAWASSVAAR